MQWLGLAELEGILLSSLGARMRRQHHGVRIKMDLTDILCSKQRTFGKDVIYSQDLGYSILGLRILNPGNLVLGLRFKDPES